MKEWPRPRGPGTCSDPVPVRDSRTEPLAHRGEDVSLLLLTLLVGRRLGTESRQHGGQGDVQWRQCTSTSADRSEACSSPPAPLEVLLVVSDVRRCEGTPTTLGKALIVPDTGGILATVYFSCVERFATSAGTDVAVLLGRVAAHELGHLMLNSSVHAHHGLMRPHWTLDEVRLNRAADWVFTAGDVAAMHAPPAEQ